MINRHTLFDPHVSPFSKASQNYDQTHFVADGEKTIARLLSSDLRFEAILCRQKYADKYQNHFLEKNIAHENILIASKKQMESIVGYSVHQGFMALCQRPAYCLVSELQPPIVSLNQIRDAENVGSLVRTALALGVNSLIFDEGSCSPYIRRAVRVSMGYVTGMRVAFSHDMGTAIEQLRRQRIFTIASTANDHHPLPLKKMAEFNFPDRFNLLLGNEGYGIENRLLPLCDHLVSIPMHNNVSSLNVANALAVLLTKALLLESNHIR